ncbi:hypothetical protein D1646_14015 [Pseudoflavonifractor sp. 60]|nr:hypothetical protein [Pseudoflavonifractor sp. 60]
MFSLGIYFLPCGCGIESVRHFQKKRSKKIFGEKSENFQGLGGPWMMKIQGPQNLDFSLLFIHSGTT